jgi:hypothetical protein
MLKVSIGIFLLGNKKEGGEKRVEKKVESKEEELFEGY